MVTFVAFVIVLQRFIVDSFRGNVLACFVVVFEGGDWGDFLVAGWRVIGAEELELELGEDVDEEGRTASVRTAVVVVAVVACIRDALHAKYTSAWAAASHRFNADLVADQTLVFLAFVRLFYEAFRSQYLCLHHWLELYLNYLIINGRKKQLKEAKIMVFGVPHCGLSCSSK